MSGANQYLKLTFDSISIAGRNDRLFDIPDLRDR